MKIKQVEGLIAALASKAIDSDVVKKSNNLSDVSASAARANLNVFSKTEVQSLVGGAENAHSVDTIAERSALSGLKVSDRVFVTNNGDNKWALYFVTATTDGTGAGSTFLAIADEDLFTNAISAPAVKSAYESNPDTNPFTDSQNTKVNRLTVSANINLDTLSSTVSSNTTTANSALTKADQALGTKKDYFAEREQVFSELSVEAETPIALELEFPVAPDSVPIVFFNSLKVNAVTYSGGETSIEVIVPYATESSDEITVVYAGE